MNYLSTIFRRTIRLLMGGALAATTGCGSPGQPDGTGKVLMHNDFESLAGWLGQAPQPSLTRERAHSGHYSLKVDAGTEYSLNYNGTLGHLSDVRITKIKLDAWVLAPNAEAGGLLVTHMGDNVPGQKALLWDGFDIVKASPQYGDWQHVSRVLEIPATATTNTNIGIFLWRNKGNQTVYLDDLAITEVK